MRLATRLLLLTSAAVVVPAGAGGLVWLALDSVRGLAATERAAWIASAAAVGWLLVAIVAVSMGRRAGPLHPADDEQAAGTHSGEPELEEIVPSVDLAGLSRAADTIAREIQSPPGPSLKRFLTFARPNRPRRRRVELNEAIAVIIEALRGTAGQDAGPPLSFDPDPQVSLVPVDTDALHRVLVNLVRNAREAAGAGGHVEVRTQSLGDRVLVAVRDDGPGVEPQELERIFQPFYTTRRGAMGLGLSICRQIAEAHGGAIRAVNILPRGLEVDFELPLSRLPLLPREKDAGSVIPTS